MTSANRAFLRALAVGIWFFLTSQTVFSNEIAVSPTLNGRSRLLWDHAISCIAGGDTKAAEKALVDLLSLTPDFFPDHNLPPKIMQPFQSARRQFFSSQHHRSLFEAKVISLTANNSRLKMIIELNRALLDRVSEIIVHLRGQHETVFRSKSFPGPFLGADPVMLEIAYPVDNMHIDYYIDFVGHFGEPFHSIGSPSWPLMLRVEAVPHIVQINAQPNEKFTAIKSGWPIIFGASIAVLGALTFGLLKLTI